MLSLAIAALFAGLSYALPQDGACATTTETTVVPSSTVCLAETDCTISTNNVQQTFTIRQGTTITASTPQDLGTYTSYYYDYQTKVLETVTPTAACSNNATTVYTKAGAPTKRALGLYPRETPCTVTETSTSTGGVTFYDYTATDLFYTYTVYTSNVQETVTATTCPTTYAIATATATATTSCAPTVTQDARCAPSALVSQSNGFGLEYAQSVSGSSYVGTTADAGQCCQLCADATKCAASAWDIQTNRCQLFFPVDYSSGELNCNSYAGLVYYDAGPNHPMAPGTGLYVANVCGGVYYTNAKPDDGT